MANLICEAATTMTTSQPSIRKLITVRRLRSYDAEIYINEPFSFSL
ncbi:MAG: hypothetical protein WCB68_04535 [Pyrinomonadaceae bacterium]